MAIQWGGFTNHLRVGIEVWTDGYDTNTPSINVYAAFYVGVDSTWSFNDAQALVLGGNAGGTWSYQNNMGANGVQHIGTYTVGGQGQNYSGGPTYSFSGTVTGNYLGAGPSATVYFTLPARPPNVPGGPGVSVDSITSTSARVLVSAADPRGAGVDAYETAISGPGANWSTWTTSFGGGTGTATGLQPVTSYQAASRAHNGVGWGPWAYSSVFTTGGTAPTVPTGLVISNLTTSGARLGWTAPSDNGGAAITSYDVQIATNAGFTTGLQTINDPASPLDLTGLTQHTQYWVKVRANNSIGPSGYSAAQSFTTNMGVTATAPAGNKSPFTTVTLTGTDISDGTVASRQWTQTSGAMVTLSGATGKTPSFYAPGTLTGTTLDFTYTVTDTSAKTYSASVSVVVNKANHKAAVGGVEVPMEFRAF